MAPGRKNSRDAPPRIYLDRGVYKADLRRWGEGRVVLRDPDTGEPTQDQEVALRWALGLVDRIRQETRGRHLRLGPKARALGEAADEWHAQLRIHRPTTSTASHRSGLNALRQFAAVDRESGRKGDQLRTNRITGALLQRFFDGLAKEGYAGNTLASYRHAIAAFLRWAGYGDRNAAHAVELVKLPHEEVATWSDDELARIREAADALDREGCWFLHHRRAVELALAAGPRRNELFALRWERISRASRTVRITQQLDIRQARLVPPKGKRPRTTLLLPSWWEHHQDAIGLVLPSLDGGLVHPQAAVRIIVRILARAGLHRAGVGWHSFRHTYSRDFIELGGRFEELQKSLGHTSIVTTERLYGHFHEDVAAALAGARIYRDGSLRAV